jgi:hypothetical protein
MDSCGDAREAFTFPRQRPPDLPACRYSPMPTPRELLDRLETRHDELLRKLDELNLQIENTLVQFGKARASDAPTGDATTASANVQPATIELPSQVAPPRKRTRRAA